MSLKYEQYRALYATKEFLRDLLNPHTYPNTKKEMRERASRCLKHFPYLDETGQPIFSSDEFECPVIKK